jgi:hypothetical protein
MRLQDGERKSMVSNKVHCAALMHPTGLGGVGRQDCYGLNEDCTLHAEGELEPAEEAGAEGGPVGEDFGLAVHANRERRRSGF